MDSIKKSIDKVVPGKISDKLSGEKKSSGDKDSGGLVSKITKLTSGKKHIFGGIEGGASSSRVILVDASGRCLSELEGPPLNHLLEGLEVCHQRIYGMIKEAKSIAKLPQDTVLTTLGLCITGCEDEIANREYEEKFLKNQPAIAKNCVVASDIVAPLFAACKNGGIILIAGTGSNAYLMNPDNSTARCGGWGHMIGDEGSAMWISQRAVKTVFDHEDNFARSKYDITMVKMLMLEHFNIENKIGILQHCYNKFKKSAFAGLCEKLALAADDRDPLCLKLFSDAGYVLADIVAALAVQVQKQLYKVEGGLPIVCVGSVWKSWHLLKPGFVANKKLLSLEEFTLYFLRASAAIGAASYGAKKYEFDFPVDYRKNITVLYHFEAKKQAK